jgi:AraC family transcriptional regulator
MEPIIKMLTEKKLVGKRLTMSLSNNKTAELWKSFMPRRKEISNNVTNDLISMQVYDRAHPFESFNLHATFEKWAVVEVTNFYTIPHDMECYTLPGGLYAVFNYKGLPSNFTATFNYMFNVWLPASNYVLDDRPHFELLGSKYKNNDPESEEEIWIPVKIK